MTDVGIDQGRRRFLTTTATVVGGAGVAAAAVPFITSMMPSAKAKAIGAPIEVEISDLAPGERRIELWQGKPVWILRRTPEMLKHLEENNPDLEDPESEEEQQPEYAKGEFRSIKPEYLILVGICTHLGCSPTYITKEEGGELREDWQGGFFCPCHGSQFDLSGRVYKNFPAPSNLVVPPYKFLSDTRVLIGDDSGVS